MKSKKQTIKLSAIISVIGIISYFALQFRLYTFLGIVNRGNEFLYLLREFCMVISSGVFTGSFVIFIISIREYNIEKVSVLNKIISIIHNIDEQFQSVNYYIPQIPVELYIGHIIYSESRETFINDFYEWCIDNDDIISEDISKYLDNPDLCEMDFIGAIMNNEPEIDWENDLEWAKKLDEKIDQIEKEYIVGAKCFFSSLLYFKSYNVFDLKYTCDEVDFFFNNKKKKDDLNYVVLFLITQTIDAINTEFRKISKKSDSKTQLISSLVRLNNRLLNFKDYPDNIYVEISLLLSYARDLVNY